MYKRFEAHFLVILISFCCIGFHSCVPTNRLLADNVITYYANKEGYNIKPQYTSQYKIEHPNKSVFGLYCDCDYDSTYKGIRKKKYYLCKINPRLITKDFQNSLVAQIEAGKLGEKINENFMEFSFVELPNTFHYKYRGDRRGLPYNVDIHGDGSGGPSLSGVFFPDVFRSDSVMVRLDFIYKKKTGEVIKHVVIDEYLKSVKTTEVNISGIYEKSGRVTINHGMKKLSAEYITVFEKIISTVIEEMSKE
jgi:hypothetical protein